MEKEPLVLSFFWRSGKSLRYFCALGTQKSGVCDVDISTENHHSNPWRTTRRKLLVLIKGYTIQIESELNNTLYFISRWPKVRLYHSRSRISGLCVGQQTYRDINLESFTRRGWRWSPWRFKRKYTSSLSTYFNCPLQDMLIHIV